MSKSTTWVECPGCKKKCEYSTSNPVRPFCSELCKNKDIADWADGKFSIEGEPANAEQIVNALKNNS